MSDPTQRGEQPGDMNEGPEPAETHTEAMANEGGAGDDGGAHKAQAYVDPTIAAEAEIATLEAENAALKDKFIRAHAEMENLRKRTEREKADTSKYAISKFAGDVLAVADNLQRALAAFGEVTTDTEEPTKALLEGIELTEAELNKALERHGVKKIEALGAIFDPNFHQAVMEEENKEIAAGTVLRVFQEGYQIGDRVLRPTMVVVARGGLKPVKASGSPAGPAANDDLPPVVDENYNAAPANDVAPDDTLRSDEKSPDTPGA